MKRTLAAAAAAVLLAAAGCSGSSVTKDATYKTAVDLKDAAVKAGYSCPDWSDTNTAASFDGATCLSDKRDQLRVYSSQAAREADMDGLILGCQIAAVTARIETSVLAGANWAICGPKDSVVPLLDKLGGYLPDMSQVKIPD